MRKKIIFPAFCLLASFLLSADIGRAQEATSIEQLKEQIRNFETIARREDFSTEVRKINQELLDERRVQLRTLLEKRIASLNEYLRLTQSSLSGKEIQGIEDSIRTLNAEFLSLKPGGDHNKPAETALEGLQGTAILASLSGQPDTNTTGPALAAAPVQTQNRSIGTTPRPVSDTALIYLRQPTAVILNSEDARALVEDAFASGAFRDRSGAVIQQPNLNDPDFHCIIHVLRWNDLVDPPAGSTDQTSQTVAAQNWYVYNNGSAKGLRSDRVWSQEDFATANRIYGAKKIWLLYVHLNKWTTVSYTAHYDFSVVKKLATNIANLLVLAKAFSSATAASGLTEGPQNVWGGSFITTNYSTSDVTVTANITTDPANGPFVALDKPKKYDNEGLHWWDVSVGVPVRRIKELEFDTTNNTVTTKEVNKQNAFALFNLYLPPKDIKSTGFSVIPHFVGGVAIAKQPLKKILVGAGFGPYFANFYVGAIFSERKEPATLTEGSTATPDQLNADVRKRYKAQFSFGINISARTMLDALTKVTK